MPDRINHRILIARHGGPETLQWIEEACPQPAPGEALVQVLAAGVSFADLLLREGVHPEALRYRPPFTPGWDIIVSPASQIHPKLSEKGYNCRR